MIEYIKINKKIITDRILELKEINGLNMYSETYDQIQLEINYLQCILKQSEEIDENEIIDKIPEYTEEELAEADSNLGRLYYQNYTI